MLTVSVMADIDRFISLGEQEQNTYAHLGIPTDILYIYREVVKGKNVHELGQVITMDGLRESYNSFGVIASEITFSLNSYLMLRTRYTDKPTDWSEEMLRYKVDGDFLLRLKSDGYDTHFDESRKSMGYGFIGDGNPYFEIFEGYPYTPRHTIDWWWYALKRGIHASLPREGRIVLKLRRNKGEDEGELVFESVAKLEKFLLKEGVGTYMSSEGRIAIRVTDSIYSGTNTIWCGSAEDKIPLNGIYLTDLVVPRMSVLI